MNEPLVSVNMITYNHEPFISRAIEGILNQKVNFPIELVIGEDCSTDRTREIVFNYQKMFPDIIRVITSEKNVGASENGKRTLKNCRGKYIAFCEGDDYWHNFDKLMKQIEFMESNPEYGMVFSDYDVYFFNSGETIKSFIKYRKWEAKDDYSISEILLGNHGILTCTVVIRRDIFNRIVESDPFLHQSGHFLMGDNQIWAEAATITKIKIINESLATHIITDESATRSKDKRKKMRFALSNIELILYLCDKYKLPSEVRKKFEEEWKIRNLNNAFHLQNADLADEIRKQKKSFTLHEWLWYFGAKSRLIHLLISSALLILDVFKKKHSEWR